MKKNLIFTNAVYRKIWFGNLKGKVKMILTKPLIPIQAVWDTFKLYRDYPDKWDRYVRLKEIENENLEMAKKENIAIARSNFAFAVFRLNICWMVAVHIRPDEEQKNVAEFQQARKELDESIKELERNGIHIPEELKSELLETPIDQFNNLEELDVFTERIYGKMD